MNIKFWPQYGVVKLNIICSALKWTTLHVRKQKWNGMAFNEDAMKKLELEVCTERKFYGNLK